MFWQDALHEDLNRHTKYSAPSAGAGDETPPNPAPARRAAKPWRLLTGYSAKRNMTVNTISNATIEKDLDKEEEGDVGLTTAPKSVDSAIAVQPSDSPPPMSVEVLLLIITAAKHYDAFLPRRMILISDNIRILL
jgi:hypothetical protein